MTIMLESIARVCADSHADTIPLHKIAVLMTLLLMKGVVQHSMLVKMDQVHSSGLSAQDQSPTYNPILCEK